MRGPSRCSVAEYGSLLRQCGARSDLAEAKSLHRLVAEEGHDRGTTFLGNLLVQMYGSCGSAGDSESSFSAIRSRNVFSWNILLTAYAQNGHVRQARSVFENIPLRDVVTWNSMISGYAQHGRVDEALQVFRGMDAQPNRLTFIGLLDCFPVEASWCLEQGIYLHDQVIEQGLLLDIQLQTALISMYGKCRSVSRALHVFQTISKPDVVACNAMLTAYALSGHLEDALTMFQAMECRTTASWNIVLSASLHCSRSETAANLFRAMDLEGFAPDRATFVTILYACATSMQLQLGRMVHSETVLCRGDVDPAVVTALVTMYGKCGRPQEAREAFGRMDPRCDDLVAVTAMMGVFAHSGYLAEARKLFDGLREVPASPPTWNVIISGYAQAGQTCEAVKLFARMDSEGVRADRITLVSVLEGQMQVQQARTVVNAIIAEQQQMDRDCIVGTAIVNMHSRSGRLAEAKAAFDGLVDQSLLSWSSMVAAYAQAGEDAEALATFREMNQQGVMPSSVTFVTVLAACAHGGLLDDGLRHFGSVVSDFGLEWSKDHFLCLADLLGRSGELCRAEELLEVMPFVPDRVAWMSLLGACRVHGSVACGSRVACRTIDMQPGDPAPYVQLLGLYSDAGMNREARAVRKLMASQNLTIS